MQKDEVCFSGRSRRWDGKRKGEGDRNNNSCLINIKSKLKILTGSEKKVGNYVLEHYMEVLNYTVTELAEKAEVSDATVVRFCRSAGYKGYQDLKIHLAQDALVPYKHLNTSLEKDDTPAQIAQKVIRAEIQTLEETLNILDMKELEQVAQVIRKARRVVFFGCGGSGAVAFDAMHKFLKIGIHSCIQTDVDIQSMESALLGPGDVAFGISHSGGNQNVLECLKNARDCKATLVGLTTCGKSPMQRLCDYLLMTSTRESIFRSESVTARVAQLSVIDSLVAVMSYMDYDSAYDAIQRTRKATSGRKY